jgi:3-oxoacyl-[acyl-carrier protein] reductase
VLSKKVAIITGGSRGIGSAIALKFASLGADIAVIYASNSEKAEDVCREAVAMGVRAIPFRCDVSDYSQAGDAVRNIKDSFGTVDILVNNAGITKDSMILNMKEEAFDAVVDISLKGAFNMIRHCSPIFLKKRSGKIINISSVSGLTGNAGQANYSAAKAGLIGLTKTVAKELASRSICCNAIAPGIIETDMTRQIIDKNLLQGCIPAGRVGQAEEVAELAAFLAQEISDYITGEVIRIDGGLAM